MSEFFTYCPRCGAPLVRRAMADRERSLCAARDCGYVHWDNPLPVVAALIQCADRDGHVLLARNQAWGEGKFGLVTGFVEREESGEQAVVREVMEEVGLACEVAGLIGVYPFTRKNEIIIAYHLIGRGDIVLNAELAEYRLIATHKLRPWGFGTGLAVRDWLARQTFSGV
jgi:NADH pyrophosphatase NudC (nudix superfamily)